MKRIFVLVAVGILVLGFIGLGAWQVQRLMWKTALIEAVNTRTKAPPVPLDTGPQGWPALTREADEYRHVTLYGRFLNDREVQVYALTEAGPGYWVMTPFVTDDGRTIMINRGYVPMDHRAPETRQAGHLLGPVSVTGLVRMSETKGWLFSQANDPARDLWFLRDVEKMAKARGLGHVPPYFVDADGTPVPGGWPRGGMTVVSFTNSHLAYALTWFSLAALLGGFTVFWLRRAVRGEDQARIAP